MRSVFSVILVGAAVLACPICAQESSNAVLITSIINRLEDLERKFSSCEEKLEQETSRHDRHEQEIAKMHEQLYALRSEPRLGAERDAHPKYSSDEPWSLNPKSTDHRRLARSEETARLIFDGVSLRLNTAMNISGECASSSVTSSGTVTGGSLTDGTATITGGAIASATSVTASGIITGGSVTTNTISGGGSTITLSDDVTASGAITGGSLTVGGDSTFSGQVDIAGSLITTEHYAFNAYPTGGQWSSGVTIAFDTTSLNEGGAYDTATYRFTAPYTGLYWFHTHMASVGSWAYIGFYVNNVLYNPATTSSTQWESAAVGAAMSLTQNDFVEVRSFGTNGGVAGPDSNTGAYFAGFSGFLVARTE